MNAISKNTVRRCSWAESDPLLRAYHDEEWGVPEYDSRALWEKLMLDGFQAGLSWSIILRKRDGFRVAFRNFDPEAVARFGKADIARLLKEPRHRSIARQDRSHDWRCSSLSRAAE
jgi:DNA-3-methyladenine glycosylase I